MPIQVYFCPKHGEWDALTTFHEDIRSARKCPECGRESTHKISPPGGILITQTWNDQANEYQRNEYTMAKAQTTNSYHEQKDMGLDVPKPTEDSVQTAAQSLQDAGKARSFDTGEKGIRKRHARRAKDTQRRVPS